MILKNLDDDDKGICRSFFPPMFGEEINTNDNHHTKEEKEQAQKKYAELKTNYNSLRDKSANEFNFYNLVEKSVLEMEGEETNRVSDELLHENGMHREDL